MDFVHCGTLEIKNNDCSLNYYIKDNAADIISIQDALDFINNTITAENSLSKKVVFYVHGFWASRSFVLHKTASVFQKNYFISPESNIAAIVHIIWSASGLIYRESIFNIDDSKRSLALLFNDIPNQIENRYSLMCHSMGNRFLYETLNTNKVDVNFEELVMVAPDLDFQLFENQPQLFTEIAKEVTVCFHSKDKTLKLSGIINRAKRLGRSEVKTDFQNIKFLDFTGLKDISTLTDKLMRHLYFITSKTVSKKIQSILDK